MGGLLTITILIVGGVVFLIGIIIFNDKKADKENKRSVYLLINPPGTLLSADLTNISGLPVSYGTVCKICLLRDKFLFMYDESQLELPFARIKDVYIQFERDGLTTAEAKKRYSDVIGTNENIFRLSRRIAYWPPKEMNLPAIISEKEVREHHKLELTEERFLVFEYTKNNTIDYHIFDASDDFAKSHRIVDFYKNQLSAGQ